MGAHDSIGYSLHSIPHTPGIRFLSGDTKNLSLAGVAPYNMVSDVWPDQFRVLSYKGVPALLYATLNLLKRLPCVR